MPPQTAQPTTGFRVQYLIRCYDRDGNLRWEEDIRNIVVTVGLNIVLDRTFKTVPPDVNWFIGFKGTGAAVAADTMSSHATWAEITPYSNATRPGFVPGAIAAGSVNNGGSTANFTINSNTNVFGVFMTTNNVKAGTTGTLFSVADFSVARTVVVDDVLAIQVTITATSV